MAFPSYNYRMVDPKLQTRIESGVGIRPASVSSGNDVSVVFDKALGANDEGNLDQVMQDLGFDPLGQSVDPVAGAIQSPERGLIACRGRIDTSTGAVLSGAGFGVEVLGAGSVRVWFKPAFSGVPAVLAQGEEDTRARVRKPLAESVEIDLLGLDGAPIDGVFGFAAVGPWK